MPQRCKVTRQLPCCACKETTRPSRFVIKIIFHQIIDTCWPVFNKVGQTICWMQVCRLIDSAKHWKFKNFQRGFPKAPSHTAACNELYMQNFVTRLFYTKHSLQSFGHKTWIWKPIKIVKTCIQILNHSTSWNFTKKGQYSSIIPKLILKILISINYMLRGVWNVQFLHSTFYSNAVSQQM